WCGIPPLEPSFSTDSKKRLEMDLQRRTSFFGSLGGIAFSVFLCVEFQTSPLYFANLSGRSHFNRPSLGRQNAGGGGGAVLDALPPRNFYSRFYSVSSNRRGVAESPGT